MINFYLREMEILPGGLESFGLKKKILIVYKYIELWKILRKCMKLCKVVEKYMKLYKIR